MIFEIKLPQATLQVPRGFSRWIFISAATFDHLSQSCATLTRFTRFDGLSQTLKVLPAISRSAWKLKNISRALWVSSVCTYRLCTHLMLCLRFTIAFECQKQQEYYEISINANFLCEMNRKETRNWNRNASNLTDTRHRHGWPKRSNYGRKQNWA